MLDLIRDRKHTADGANAAHLAALMAFGALPASALAGTDPDRSSADDAARRHDGDARARESERAFAIV